MNKQTDHVDGIQSQKQEDARLRSIASILRYVEKVGRRNLMPDLIEVEKTQPFNLRSYLIETA